MINLKNIRYVRLGTADLASTVEFANQVIGVDIVRRERGCVYLSSDQRDHTLCYFEGDPADHVVAFDVDSAASLDSAADELDNAGYTVTRGSHSECDDRHLERFIAFRDPTGNKIELIWGAGNRDSRVTAGPAVGITEFSHIGLRSTDPVRDEAFWTSISNARVSDRIGVAPLLRIDEVHHKIALFPSQTAGVQHINHQVGSIDDLMQAWYRLKNLGVRIVFGPGRHPTSNAIFLYYEGSDGMVYEYSTGVRYITDPDYQPRQFPFAPEGFCMWGALPDIPEFK
jgi:2,3-dihydroxy-p-cumate/2,3-dihydroxybenzoate 3,4-dioxygenase